MPAWIIDPLLFITLMAIFVEDIRHRQVHLLWFVIGLSLFGFRFWQSEADTFFLLINGGFISVQLLGIIGYAYFKKRKINPFNGILGPGDLLLWGIVIFGFSPVNFILYFILSLIFTLMIYGFFLKKRSGTIPLAGLQALCYVLVWCTQLLGWEYNFYSDDLWITILAPLN